MKTWSKNLKNRIDVFSSELTGQSIPLNVVRVKIDNLLQELNKWNAVKDRGIEGLPVSVQKDALALINELGSFGIFEVNVGELES